MCCTLVLRFVWLPIDMKREIPKHPGEFRNHLQRSPCPLSVEKSSRGFPWVSASCKLVDHPPWKGHSSEPPSSNQMSHCACAKLAPPELGHTSMRHVGRGAACIPIVLAASALTETKLPCIQGPDLLGSGEKKVRRTTRSYAT